ncbi:zinc-ribbon domain-containing protein [Myroides odoratus]|uniref:zinc-ribbon domain-containing protein n=1 Tax=Myroides odoratus TaxID=256 RepID=UPI0039B11B05
MKIVCSNCKTENEKTSKYCSVCGYKLLDVEIESKTEDQPTEVKVKPKRKYNITAILGIVLGMSIIYLFNYYLNSSISIDKSLAKFSSEMNKNCPLVVDQDLVLENTVALPNKTFQYNISIVTYEKAEINLDTVQKYFFSGILQNIKTNPDMKELRAAKVTFNYSYKDKKGEFVTKYSVTPEMYEEK